MTLNPLHRHVAILLATLWASVCLALPAPHDIEQAVAKGQLPQAERMLREVIAEKPNSARAHYELAQVLAREGQPSEALQAIRQARALDASLQFAQSPEKFNAVAQAIEQQAAAKASPATAHAPVAVAAPTAPTTPTQAAWMWPALLTGGFALLALWLWRRVQARPTLQPAGMDASMGQRGFGAQYDPRGGAAPGYGYGQPYPAASGSGVAGAVVGGLAGVAAGYALSKALDSHDHPAHTSTMDTPRANDPMADTGLVRMDPGADLGSFDAGAGDDWGGDTGASSDDNW
jgi:hypothetical protein